MRSDLVLAAADPRAAVAAPHRVDHPGLSLALQGSRSLVAVVGRPDDGDRARIASTGGTLLRLRADRHLVVDGAGAEVVAAAVAGRPLSVFDVSDAHAGVALDGPLAEALVAAGSAADLSPAAFRVGTAIETELGRLAVLILRRAGDGFDLFVDAPSLGFAWSWLTATATLVATAGDPVNRSP